MNEKMIEEAKKDSRVELNKNINGINIFKAIPNNKIDKIVIYCHGLGSNKNWVLRFYDKLLENNIGIIAFDFPGHGQDETNFKEFDLSKCLSYLEKVIFYVKNEYKTPIYLFGCSFGGFVILNRLVNNSDDIMKTILMCPAINFCEIMEKKSGISIDYFKNNDFMPLYNNIKIYKNAYIQFKDGDKIIENKKFENISIIQGDCDTTVLYDDIKRFCEKNEIFLKTIKEGTHELYGFDNEIIDFLIESIIP